MQISDIHTHKPAPQPEAVVQGPKEGFSPLDGQYYSIGIHPWDTASGNIEEQTWRRLADYCAYPEVVAVGECGIDMLKGGPLFMQMQVFKRQIEISEKLRKPLIIHCVKAHDVIIGMKKEIKPMQNWVVHGFRGKPSVGKMLTDAGIWRSFGSRFNPLTVAETDPTMMLAETDDSPILISEVISSLSDARGEDLTETILVNSLRFLSRVGGD